MEEVKQDILARVRKSISCRVNSDFSGTVVSPEAL